MSYEERRPKRHHLSTSRDIAMGLAYMFIGGFVLYFQAFGNMALPAWVAYLLGSMMVIGGGARFYKGIKVLLPKKENKPLSGE